MCSFDAAVEDPVLNVSDICCAQPVSIVKIVLAYYVLMTYEEIVEHPILLYFFDILLC